MNSIENSIGIFDEGLQLHASAFIVLKERSILTLGTEGDDFW